MKQNRPRSLHSSVWRSIEIHSQDGHISYYPLSSTGELQMSFPRQKRRNFHITNQPSQPDATPTYVPIPLKKKYELTHPNDFLVTPNFPNITPLYPVITPPVIKFPIITAILSFPTLIPADSDGNSQQTSYIVQIPNIKISSPNEMEYE